MARTVRLCVLMALMAASAAACARDSKGAAADTRPTATRPSTTTPALPITRALSVDVAGTVYTLTPETLRSWLDATTPTQFDPTLIVAGLRSVAGAHSTAAVGASFVVDARGVPQLVPARPGSECCDPAAANVILQAVRAEAAAPVAIPLRAVAPAFGDAQAGALGITASIGAFTTKHACCEARVQNIHRIVDLLRGTIVPPDGTFSVNGAVGRRTEANGFVAAPVITNHTHDTAVGGGISQFATTLFNAAFFGGLDLVEYQSHSLYINRYPYGREATLSYPSPDLRLHNPTPCGVLMWPTYTDTSITVTLYSTPWFRSVTTGAQSTMPRGTCTVVETPRTRVFPDAGAVLDVVLAVYHREGQSCSGRQPGVS